MEPKIILSEAPATPDYDDAQNKLRAAQSIVDCMAMLACTGDIDGLKKNSMATALLHAEELIDEARQMFEARQCAQFSQRKCVMPQAHEQPGGSALQ